MNRATRRTHRLFAALAVLAVGCAGASHSDDTGPADVPGDDAGSLTDGSHPSSADVPSLPPPPPAGEVLPAFDAATEANVRAIVERGRARGNRHQVVAKIGDSITESQSFLGDCGFGWYHLGTYAGLEPTIQYFRSEQLGDGRNALNRTSLSAVAGWTTADALGPGGDASPVAQELDAIHPQWAIVMYGTNDLERLELATYQTNLRTIVELIQSRDVVAVLSTIPPRGDGEPFASRVAAYNDVVRAVAMGYHLPLIDYWVALTAAPNHGLGPDGVHPNLYYDGMEDELDGCEFTDPALQFGYNLRNLTALEMLTRLRAY
jgi:lysophospholipase L1-like esterase